jgi:uncharacterized protein HemY
MNACSDRVREARWYADQLFAGRHYRAVLALVNKALHDGVDDTELRLRRARALLALHRDAEAKDELIRVAEQSPSAVGVHLLLCEIALRQKDLPAAERSLVDAMRRDVRHPRLIELTAVIRGWRLAAVRRAA